MIVTQLIGSRRLFPMGHISTSTRSTPLREILAFRRSLLNKTIPSSNFRNQLGRAVAPSYYIFVIM